MAITCKTACCSRRSVTVGIPVRVFPVLRHFFAVCFWVSLPPKNGLWQVFALIAFRSQYILCYLSGRSYSSLTGIPSTPAEPLFDRTCTIGLRYRFFRFNTCSIILCLLLFPCSAYRKASA